MSITQEQREKLQAVGDANEAHAGAVLNGTASEVIITNSRVRTAELDALAAGVPKGVYRRHGATRYIAAKRQLHP